MRRVVVTAERRASGPFAFTADTAEECLDRLYGGEARFYANANGSAAVTRADLAALLADPSNWLLEIYDGDGELYRLEAAPPQGN